MYKLRLPPCPAKIYRNIRNFSVYYEPPQYSEENVSEPHVTVEEEEIIKNYKPNIHKILPIIGVSLNSPDIDYCILNSISGAPLRFGHCRMEEQHFKNYESPTHQIDTRRIPRQASLDFLTKITTDISEMSGLDHILFNDLGDNERLEFTNTGPVIGADVHVLPDPSNKRQITHRYIHTIHFNSVFDNIVRPEAFKFYTFSRRHMFELFFGDVRNNLNRFEKATYSNIENHNITKLTRLCLEMVGPKLFPPSRPRNSLKDSLLSPTDSSFISGDLFSPEQIRFARAWGMAILTRREHRIRRRLSDPVLSSKLRSIIEKKQEVIRIKNEAIVLAYTNLKKSREVEVNLEKRINQLMREKVEVFIDKSDRELKANSVKKKSNKFNVNEYQYE